MAEDEAGTALNLVASIVDTLTGFPLASMAASPAAAAMRRRVERKSWEVHDGLVRDLAVLGRFGDESNVHEHVRALLADEANAGSVDMLMEGFRAAVAAIDDAALPHISRLMAFYLFERRPRDSFFRRASALLAEAEARDIAQLRHIARVVSAVLTRDPDADRILVMPFGKSLKVKPWRGKDSSLRPEVVEWEPVDDAVDLLKKHRLATDATDAPGAFYWPDPTLARRIVGLFSDTLNPA